MVLGETVNILASQIGIDVAKDELVVSVEGAKALRFANTSQGCVSLLELVSKAGVVHLEASGGYERLVVRLLQEQGIKVLVHNPLKPKRMAQAKGKKAKTDPVDARGLAQWGDLLPEGSVKAQERRRLADHARAIHTLKETASEMKKRMQMPELDPLAKALYAQTVQDLEKRVREGEKALDKRIKESGLCQWYKLAMSVPCLGRVSARALVVELPEDFLERTPGEICSYAGLAPMDDSSGKRQGQAHLGRGNPRLKGAFYMPALTAVKSQSWARELYDRLRARGRGHQSAIVAVMRRLLLRAVAVLQRGTPWKDETQKA